MITWLPDDETTQPGHDRSPDPPPVTRIVFWAVCMASAPVESVIERYHPTA
jgi:hypothetical protein